MNLCCIGILLVSLCSAAEFQARQPLLRLVQDYVADPNGPALDPIKSTNAEWETNLSAIVPPLALNALKIGVDYMNNMVFALEEVRAITLSDMTAKWMDSMGQMFVNNAGSMGLLTKEQVLGQRPNWASFYDFIADGDGMLSITEYLLLTVSDYLFASLAGPDKVIDAAEWARFVRAVEMMSENTWVFQAVAGTDNAISLNEFMAFMVFVCTSSGADEVSGETWTHMHSSNAAIAALVDDVGVLQWSEWLNRVCASEA